MVLLKPTSQTTLSKPFAIINLFLFPRTTSNLDPAVLARSPSRPAQSSALFEGLDSIIDYIDDETQFPATIHNTNTATPFTTSTTTLAAIFF